MKLIKEALKLTDPEEIKEEIQARNDLIKRMVGSLYLTIVFDEIVALRELYVKLFNKYDC